MNTEPLFIQFANTIKQKVLNREYQYGDKLPTEEELSSAYNMNRKTIRKAKQLLISEGVLLSVRGKGTFINRPPLRYNAGNMQNSFSARSLDVGSKPTSKVLFAGQIDIGNLNRIFNLGEEEKLYRLLRIRYMDGIPLAIENAFIPYHLIPDIEKYDFSIHSLYAAIEEHNIYYYKEEMLINVIRTSSYIARILKIPIDAGLFKIEFINYDVNDRVVEYTQFYSTDDKVDIWVK